MPIDKSGEWWVGTDPSDVAEYLVELGVEGYEVQETRICRCKCGTEVFLLEFDEDEGSARRTCTKCNTRHFICDSAEYWDDAEPEPWACTECDHKEFNLAVGFSLYDLNDGQVECDVRWISVGHRCTKCGILGSCVDWKVGYGPSYHLLEQA